MGLIAIEKTEKYFYSIRMSVCIAQPSCGVVEEVMTALALGCMRDRTRPSGPFRGLGYEDFLNIYRLTDD